MPLSPNAFSPWLVASAVCRELPAWLRYLLSSVSRGRCCQLQVLRCSSFLLPWFAFPSP